MSVVSLMDGIFTVFQESPTKQAKYLRDSMDWIGWGDAPKTKADGSDLRYPYIAYDHVLSGGENYVMDEASNDPLEDDEDVQIPYYQTIEIMFNIVTGTVNGQPDKSPRQCAIFSDYLKKLFRRGNFALTDGRVIDAVIVEDWAEPNGDSDGYVWHVGIQFDIGT
jgi:hypothetical protein